LAERDSSSTSLQEKLKLADDNRTLLQNSLTEKEAALTQMQNSLSEREANLTQVTSSLREKKATLTQMKGILREKEAALAERTAALEDKTSRIAELQQREGDLAIASDRQQKMIASLNATVNDLESALHNGEKNTAAMEKQLQERVLVRRPDLEGYTRHMQLMCDNLTYQENARIHEMLTALQSDLAYSKQV